MVRCDQNWNIIIRYSLSMFGVKREMHKEGHFISTVKYGSGSVLPVTSASDSGAHSRSVEPANVIIVGISVEGHTVLYLCLVDYQVYENIVLF